MLFSKEKTNRKWPHCYRAAAPRLENFEVCIAPTIYVRHKLGGGRVITCSSAYATWSIVNTLLTVELKIEMEAPQSKQTNVQDHHILDTTRNDPHNPYSAFKLLYEKHDSLLHSHNLSSNISNWSCIYIFGWSHLSACFQQCTLQWKFSCNIDTAKSFYTP